MIENGSNYEVETTPKLLNQTSSSKIEWNFNTVILVEGLLDSDQVNIADKQIIDGKEYSLLSFAIDYGVDEAASYLAILGNNIESIKEIPLSLIEKKESNRGLQHSVDLLRDTIYNKKTVKRNYLLDLSIGLTCLLISSGVIYYMTS